MVLLLTVYLLRFSKGVSITSGTRYILTGFCNYADPNISGKELYASFDEKFDGFAFSGHSREWGPPYYNSKTDGDRDLISNGERALVSRTESGCDLTTLDHEADHIGNGVRIGDILKAIWISDDSGDDSVPMHYKDSMRDPVTVSPENSFNSDKRVVGETLHGSNRGRFVMLDGLTSKEIKLLVFLSGKAAHTHGCLILVKSDCAADEDDANNEEQRNLQYNAWRLLSTGKYWSYDEALLDLIS